jgi:hypothetical protein
MLKKRGGHQEALCVGRDGGQEAAAVSMFQKGSRTESVANRWMSWAMRRLLARVITCSQKVGFLTLRPVSKCAYESACLSLPCFVLDPATLC